MRKARNKVFHLNCFTCMVCNKQLSTGEELYVIDENKFVCKEDYLSSGAIKEVNLNSGNHAFPVFRRPILLLNDQCARVRVDKSRPVPILWTSVGPQFSGLQFMLLN